MDTIVETAEAPAAPPLRQWFGHPRGLYVIFGSELWERISFHGMQALLTLYMVDQLLLPGHIEHVAGFPAFRSVVEAMFGRLTTLGLASQIFGLYVALVYFTPIVGGWLGDRVLGRHRTVALGAALMAAGHFAMAFDASFLLALLLLILGAGAFRGNLSAQIDTLYDKSDRRRADAFQIYGAAINAGAFLAPLITGALAKGYGWHFGFGFAGVGMLIGLLIYVIGMRDLPADRGRTASVGRAKLTPGERRRVLWLFLLLPVPATYWIAQSQVWNVYNLWARDHVNLNIGGFAMPVVWLQSIDGLAPLATMPLAVAFWRWQASRGREPDNLIKMALGCLIFGAGTAWLALGDVLFAGSRIPLVWALAFHLISNVGWLYLSPIAIAVYATSAPASMRGVMLGVNTASAFIGSIISGSLGRLYEVLKPEAFWLVHAAIPAAGGLFLIALARPFRRNLDPET